MNLTDALNSSSLIDISDVENNLSNMALSQTMSSGQLINDGLFKYCRNINYFGELLIYSSFSLLAMHWIPWVVLLLFIILIWFPNMLRKDKSLAKYDNFEDYKKGSKLFIPFIY